MTRARPKLPLHSVCREEDGPDYTVHYEGPKGFLCNWDGGLLEGETDEPVDCEECLETVAYLWRLWHPRAALPRRTS